MHLTLLSASVLQNNHKTGFYEKMLLNDGNQPNRTTSTNGNRHGTLGLETIEDEGVLDGLTSTSQHKSSIREQRTSTGLYGSIEGDLHKNNSSDMDRKQ